MEPPTVETAVVVSALVFITTFIQRHFRWTSPDAEAHHEPRSADEYVEDSSDSEFGVEPPDEDAEHHHNYGHARGHVCDKESASIAAAALGAATSRETTSYVMPTITTPTP
ncbi:uncharacterized protein LOC62_05G007614 [Vanrija pseudolonga]|uniref:Uncharacterized protein n=1 Tax=Vanrija pseudolonga TaxID=143232 RepID=A0AAF0YDT5_9TREE|nr:hypothetical protein LOC62_05G007614 [Vanrija pseudolonga]